MQIHDYAKEGNIEGLSRLIAEGVPIDCLREEDAFTPLMCAAVSSKADLQVLQFLIKKGANLNAVSIERIHHFNFDFETIMGGNDAIQEEVVEGDSVLSLAIRNANLRRSSSFWRWGLTSIMLAHLAIMRLSMLHIATRLH
jgi:ankyrin repeat protein